MHINLMVPKTIHTTSSVDARLLERKDNVILTQILRK